ncbi:PLATZ TRANSCRIPTION FACTOR FAMILY PROTEIN [Salix purpurea]|uniref:PLATZ TRANSCRIPTION FACTOR FAMILY PROTEIN n=1 Tax=Salix purpurea TaxID=77065 RepID=A0A9Q0ZRF2_SALPP|nr:PLATZ TRANSCRIPTION FACTOR FAMILY PROTEIN [Salix purpurea]
MSGALCAVCLSLHNDHGGIRIRSSYHDVIRVSEIQKYLDIAGVGLTLSTSAMIVFLNERPRPRHSKGVTNTCHVRGVASWIHSDFCSLWVARLLEHQRVSREEVKAQGDGWLRHGRINEWPPWLHPLLRTSFFVQCKLHADARRANAICNAWIA